MSKTALFVVISLLISKPIFGQSNEIVASFGGTLPPYVLQDPETKEWLGLSVDLVEQLAVEAGFTYDIKDYRKGANETWDTVFSRSLQVPSNLLVC